MDGRRNWFNRLLPLVRVVNWFEVQELRWLGFCWTGVWARTPMLVIETVGRRSGRRRRTPIPYAELDSGVLLIGGGAGGMTTVPGWVANVRAQPGVTVIKRRRSVPMCAVGLAGDDWEVARELAFGFWPHVRKYERLSGRRLPLFHLVPVP